jgi:hypothetical protein
MTMTPHTATVADTSDHAISRGRQIGHFLLHYAEMCIPMCIGFAIGDVIYFWAAGRFGYSKPFSELPALSVGVVTVAMTVPMTAWMLYRGMARRPVVEMTATMPILAVVLLALGWIGSVPKDDLALTEHGLMMPVMLVPMFWRLSYYAGRGRHGHGARFSATTAS